MKKRLFTLCLVLGLLLLAVSVGLFLWQHFAAQAGAEAGFGIASRLEEMLPQRTQGDASHDPGGVMPVLELEGTDYVALLEVRGNAIPWPTAGPRPKRLPGLPAQPMGRAWSLAAPAPSLIFAAR